MVREVSEGTTLQSPALKWSLSAILRSEQKAQEARAWLSWEAREESFRKDGGGKGVKVSESEGQDCCTPGAFLEGEGLLFQTFPGPGVWPMLSNECRKAADDLGEEKALLPKEWHCPKGMVGYVGIDF